MTATYSESQRRLNHILGFFFAGCALGILVGAIHYNWWFATVWLVAGSIGGVIRLTGSQSAVTPNIAENNEVAGELPDELAAQRAFSGKFLKFTSLLAATVLAAGFALENPWWGNLLVATITWFASMFGIPLLCGPRKIGETEVVE